MSNGAETLETFRQQVLAQYDATQRTITVGSNIVQQVATLLGFAQTGSVILTDATVTSTPAQVMIRGNGVMAKLGGNQSIELIGVAVAGSLGLKLSATPQSAIRLVDLFPNLPNSNQNVAGIQVEQPSLFYQIGTRNPMWLITDIEPPSGVIYPSVGLNLRTTVPLQPIFSHVATLTQTTEITFKGPIAFPVDDVTQLYLSGEFPGFTSGIGPLRMHDFQLVIRTVYYNDATEFSFTGSLFAGVLDVSDGVAAQIGVDIQSVPQDTGTSSVWAFFADFGDKPLSLSAGLNALAVFAGGDAGKLELPDAVRSLGSFGLTRLVVGVDPYKPTIIEFVFIEVGSPKRWDPPIPYIAIENVRVQWQILQPFSADWSQSGGVGGTLLLGKENPVHLDITATIPEFIIDANLRQGDQISLVNVLTEFFPDAGGLSQDFVIDSLNIVANFDSKVYELSGSVKPVPPLELNLVITTLTLNGVSASVNYSQDALYATILADLTLFSKGWLVSAEYMRPGEDEEQPGSTTGNWIFALRLRPGDSINLSELVATFLNFNPALIPTISIEGLYCRYNLGDKTYQFQGTVKGHWQLDIIPGQPALQASATIDVENFVENSVYAYRGSVIGSISIGALTVTVGYAFDPKNTNYSFSIVYKRFALYATLMRTTKKKDGVDVPVSILRISLGDISIGEIIEYLVNLANPNIQFRLEGPWDILNSLNLKNLSLVADLIENTVGIEYRLDLELVFLYIESVSLTYMKRKDGRGTVRMGIKGRFLEQSFGDGDELSWDLLDDPAPVVPGRGNSLFDLKFVGLGQHVSLKNHTSFESVSEVIKALRDEMKPVANPGGNPLSQPNQSGLVFDKDSSILFGAQFVVLGGVAISAVFNDPYLYGLLIELSGDVAGSLAGLRFELLYIRITDTLGVFKVVLRVPDAFRQLEFGAVSVTLPTIKLDIYTNGNFKIDLGFPVARDFTESFGVQVFPFIGKGGFYFGYLIGAASKTVPRITNGAFAPVIELGLALAVGVGKEISKGPLSAGLSLTVEAILEGTLAWFQPFDRSQPNAMYFRVAGTATLIGKLYGAVDFKIIKVSIALTARASVTLVVECYQPILVRLSVEVSVQASVSILFITIHFSFDIGLDVSFTIGSASLTPWVVDPAALPTNPNRLTANRALPGGRRQGLIKRARPVLTRLRLRKPTNRVPAKLIARRSQTPVATRLRLADLNLAGLALETMGEYFSAFEAEPAFEWTPRAVFSSVQFIPVLILPALTVAGNAYLLPEDRSTGAVSNQIALTFVFENGIHPDAQTLTALRQLTASAAHSTSDPSQLPFSLVVKGMLAWSIASFIELGGNVLDGTIDRWELEALVKALDTADADGNAFTAAQLEAFQSMNFLYRIGAYTGDPTAVNRAGASFMPIPPLVTMQVADQPPINFANYRMVGAAYEDAVANYFAQTAVDYGSNTATDPDGFVRVTPTDPDPVSVAAMVQRDYYLLIARSAAETALQQMNALPRAVVAANSLSGLANDYPRVAVTHIVQSGETTEILENTYFMTLAELQQLNPGVDFTKPLPAGISVRVLEGPTAWSILAANKDKTGLLAASAILPIEGANYQVRSGDNLSAIATSFAVTLADLVNRNLASTELLAPGAIFQLPAFTYTSVAGDTLDFVAAWLLVRNGVAPALPAQDWFNLPQFAWYEQAVAMLNYNNNGDYVNFDGPLTPGTQIKVPSAFNESGAGTALTYASRAGDTLQRIAGYFALTQNPTAGFVAFRNALQVAGNPAPTAPLPVGSSVTVPAWQHAFQTVDSFALLGEALGLTEATITASASLQDPAILSPLAVVALPSINYALPDDKQTFAGLAQHFNMDLEMLARSIAVTSGYFVPSTIIIPDVASLSVAVLLDATISASNQIASSASRFMMNGLRLPEVPPTPSSPVITTDLYGLYEIVGQQIPIDKFTLPLSIGITSNAAPNPPTAPGGILLYQTHLVVAGETYESLLALYPNLPEYNPGITPTDVVPGLLLFVVQLDQLPIVVEQTFVDANKASAELTLAWTNPIKPIAEQSLVETNPLRTTLPIGVHWQAATPPSWAGQATVAGEVAGPGEATLWSFPQNILDAIRSGATGANAYRLMLGTVDAQAKMHLTNVVQYDWAALLELQLRRVPLALPQIDDAIEEQPPTDAANAFMPNTYEVLSASEDAQRVLLGLWSWIKANPKDAGADIRVLYAPSSQSDNPSGWQSLDLAKAQTFIFRSNLSTLSTSGHNQQADVKALLASVDEPAADELAFADISDSANFLDLLWSAGVVGTGGYFLNYVAGEQGLPDTIFDQQGNASLRLLVILPTQSKTIDPVRSFYPFNTCAVVGDNIVLGEANLFLERADGSEKTSSATVPPGVFAFAGTRVNPGQTPPAQDVDKWRTQVLYSLIGYRSAEAGGFKESNRALPIGPAVPPLLQESFRTAETPVDLPWFYQQNLPAYVFAATSPVHATGHLPPPEQDPYAGIAANAALTVEFTVHDLYGNRLDPANPIPNAPLNVGYTDPLIPLSAWPGTTASYDFTGVQNPTTGQYDQAGIQLRLSLQVSNYVPGPGIDSRRAQTNISADALKYAQVFYQIEQPDLKLWLNTSLMTNPADPSGNFPVDLTGLRQYVQAVCIALKAAAQLQPVTVSVASGTTVTFASLAQTWPVSIADIGKANANSALNLLFASVIIPSYAVFPQQGTLLAVATAAGLTPATLAGQNTNAPLSAGVVLLTPDRTITTTATATSFRETARANRTTVDNIATRNAPTPGLLVVGVPVVVDNVTLAVELQNSLNELVTRFAAAGITTTPEAIAAANADTIGLVAGAQPLTVSAYVTAENQTFATLAALVPAWTVAAIATASQAVVNSVQPGTALYLAPGAQVTPSAGDTFASLALTYGRTVEQLAVANSLQPLLVNAKVQLPGLSTIGAGPVYVPYAVPQNATWTTIVTALGLTAIAAQVALMTSDERMPDLLLAGVTIQVGNNHAVTSATSTFRSVLDDLNQGGGQSNYADLIAAIQTTPALMRPGGAIAAPPPAVPEATSLSDFAATFGLSAAELALANASLSPLIAAGQPVTVTTPNGDSTVTTQANDSFTTIAARFQANFNLTVSVEQIAAAVAPNPSFLIATTQVMLPPRAMNLDVVLYTAMPATPPYPGTVFELVQTLILERTDAILDEFSNVAAVKAFRVAIAPRLQLDSNGSYLLAPFAANAEAIFTGLKLAVGAQPSTEQAQRMPHLIAVNFTSTGIANVDIAAGNPATLAIKPLSTSPLSAKGLSIAALQADGTLGTATPHDFSAIDLDAWASTALAAIDLVLSPQLAAPAQGLDAASFTALVGYKAQLAATASYGLIPVLSDTTALNLTAARKRLEQSLLNSLSGGFSTAAVLQYGVGVTSTNAGNARLSGRPVAVLKSDNPGETQGVFTLSLTAATTFEAIQQFFSIDMHELIAQMAGLTPLLQQGSVFAFPGQPSYTVPNATTTLAGVATHFGLLEPTPLAEYNRTVPGYFVPGTVLSITMPIPSFDLGVGKTPLASSANGTIEFLLTVPKQREHKTLLANLDYQLNELEYDIAAVTGSGGFSSSKWLSFIIPITAANRPAAVKRTLLGQAAIPLVLRAYPELPVLREQSSQPAVAILPPNFPENLLAARKWEYQFDFEQIRAAQDSTFLTVNYNRGSSLLPGPLRGDQLMALFAALAQFNFVWPELKKILLGLIDPATVAAQPQLLKNAIATFKGLVGKVSSAWAAFWLPTAAADALEVPQPSSFEAEIVPIVDARTDTPALRSLVLQAQNQAGYDFAQYPRIAYYDAKQNTYVSLTKTPTNNPREVVYQVAAPILAYQRFTWRYTFDALDVVIQENAAAAIVVKRNTELLPQAKTADAFVYETPAVSFATPIVPSLLRNEFIDARTSPAETLAEVVEAIFDALLDVGDQGHTLKVVARYGYELASPLLAPTPAEVATGGIVSEIPVTYFPKFLYASAFDAELVDALDTWYKHHLPATRGGMYLFDLTLYSALMPDLIQPILRLRRIAFPLVSI
jgi:LysM repeat protein